MTWKGFDMKIIGHIGIVIVAALSLLSAAGCEQWNAWDQWNKDQMTQWDQWNRDQMNQWGTLRGEDAPGETEPPSETKSPSETK